MTKPIFTSISSGLPIRQDQCDLVEIHWATNIYVAKLGIWKPSNLSAVFTDSKSLNVKVTLKYVIGYRVLEEMVHSIYGDGFSKRRVEKRSAFRHFRC